MDQSMQIQPSSHKSILDGRSRTWQALLLAIPLCSFGAPHLLAATRQIDIQRSTLTIHVGKAGLLSAAGHEHVVVSRIAEGTITESDPAHIAFRVEAAKLTVQPEDHQAEIQQTMQERVLESARFPEIAFASQTVRKAGDNKWIVSGLLQLHGQKKPVEAHLQYLDGVYKGNASIKQTDFGIQPVSAAGGTVRVKNELKIDFAIAAK